MIKRILSVLIAAMMMASITGCHKRSVIPDDTLAKIFHDAFVVNAYIGEEHLNLDSLKVYEPIFEKYGYTAEDVVYTVGNFSRRKSARLGTVVERAISRLESENKYYTQQIVMLDTIQNVAVRTYTRVLYQDTLIKAVKRADSTLLQLEISPISKGEYTISYNYKYDGDIKKYPRKAELYFQDEDGFRSGYSSVMLNSFGKVNRTLVARNAGHKLILDLAHAEKPQDKKSKNSRDKGKNDKGKKTPMNRYAVTIRNLKVTYKPKVDIAIDSLFSRYVDVKIFADEFLVKKDSLALSADSTRVSIPTAHHN